jgi:putative transposase
MPYDPQKHHRRSVRLNSYDYAKAGMYFVTICTQHGELYFDQPEIRAASEACWQAIPEHHIHVELDEWVVMPNHINGIILIAAEDVRRGAKESGVRQGVQLNAPTVRDPQNMFSVISPERNSLAVIVRTYKAAVTTACRKTGKDEFAWQRSYYEHVVRSHKELNAIRRYIENNPLKWALDRDNPQNKQAEGVKDYWEEVVAGK